LEEILKNLVPYSVYLPIEYHEKIKELAKERKASSTVRDAICMILDGDDTFKAGYNKALKDCARQIDEVKEIEHIAVRGKYLNNLLSQKIEALEM
jgi:bisphosphoglycerate-independent phosphoglycerate mutase (AlkP superfamily)